MAATAALSDEDLAAVRAELSTGKPVTVWFTAAAVGVPADGSAKVISLDDAAEGDFIQVRPAGTRDTMFCSPNELTRTRPARKRPARTAVKAPEPAAQPTSQPPSQPASQPPSALPSSPPSQPRPPAPEVRASQPAAQPPAPRAERNADRPGPAATRAAARPAEVTVTLNATAEGEWTVEVTVGKKRRVRATPVQPADVAKAARALPPAVAEAIESSLEAARQRQLERVERLRAELESAQKALRELSG